MRIGLNLLHALPEIGGGWNYIANMVSALGEYDNTNTYIAFTTQASGCLVPAHPNFINVPIDIRSSVRPQRIAYENGPLQWLARQYQLDGMHWFANTQALINIVPGVVTVYDLHPFLNFATYSLIKRLYLRLMVSLTARRAALLFPISQTTANDLQRVLKTDPARIVVIPPLLPAHFVPASLEDVASFKTQYNLPEMFWLYVAHLSPHKNHIRLLQAYHQLKLSGFGPWPLVLRGDPAGAECEIRETITLLNLESDIFLLSRLAEAKLPILFSAATGLVFPSLYEGGGIPIVEAMACGCPVIAADIPVIREFAGEAASYFDPLNLEAIGQAMIAFQSNATAHDTNQRLGLARAEEFRAQPIISKLLEAYRKTFMK